MLKSTILLEYALPVQTQFERRDTLRTLAQQGIHI